MKTKSPEKIIAEADASIATIELIENELGIDMSELKRRFMLQRVEAAAKIGHKNAK